MVVEDDDDDISEVIQPEQRVKGKTKASASPAINGKPAPKAKGNGKVDSTANGYKSRSDLVVIEELDDDEPHVKPLPPAKKGKTRTGTAASLEEGEIAFPSDLKLVREERDLVRRPLVFVQIQCD
jgi:hypothetical protein